MLGNILAAYGIQQQECTVQPFGTGLINHTWKVVGPKGQYILQRVNQEVFKNPWAIAENIHAVGDFLRAHYPDYLFIEPLPTLEGKSMVHLQEEGYFRLLPFVDNSYSYDTVDQPGLAYEAAKQFGKFTKNLSAFPAGQLHATLPEFHNLSLRYQQFEEALLTAAPFRMGAAAKSIAFIKANKWVAEKYAAIQNNPDFKLRVTHHDTKISNVLFDKEGKGLCVIDLDTLMPGYFISDVGDMMRTYLPPVSEAGPDFSKIEIREAYFTAILQGYLSEMQEELGQEELDHFVYAGQFMIYMQATRFLTDYLNNDIYYGAKYEHHNLIRANNQIALLQCLYAKEARLQEIVAAYKPLV